MKNSIRLTICVALAIASVNASVWAAQSVNSTTEKVQAFTGPRTVQVLIAQTEIKTDINPSNLDVATGGGLLGGLLAASQNASRAKKAEAAIVPVRTALANFDVEALALATTKSGLASTAWLKPAAIAMSKDSSLLGKSGFVDSNGAEQVAFVEYSYDMSPDFSAVRVVAKLQFANKAMPAAAKKPEARLAPKNLAFDQSITSIISLSAPNKEIDANAATWAADDGKKVRAALAMAFTRIQGLMPRALATTQADIKLMTGKDKVKGAAGGFRGRIQETTAEGILLWSGGFIHAQILP
jgi:hypothetical protein